MPASRRVNAAHVQAVSHVENVWHAIVEHVRGCQQCKTKNYWQFIPVATCEWGMALADEWRIANERLNETNNTARGGTAQPTQGAKS